MHHCENRIRLEMKNLPPTIGRAATLLNAGALFAPTVNGNKEKEAQSQ
jgi:hypothetical protein